MAGAVARSYGKNRQISNMVGATGIQCDRTDQNPPTNPDTFTRKISDPSKQGVSSSSYITSDVSDLSGDVDRWMNGSNSSTPVGFQGGRTRVAQRSTVTSSGATQSLWYLAAMILPLFSVHNCVMTLRCTHSTLVNTAAVFVQHISRICSRAKARIQRLARDRFAGEVFAATVDVVLVVYALGFLFLSMYQATIIG